MLVADKRRKDPRSIPRPWESKKKRRPEPGMTATPEGGVVATGLAGMLSATQMRGAVSLG